MDENQPVAPIKRNPVTHLKHRREVLGQITFPLSVGVLIALALVALVVFQTTASQASRWADISIIWLIVPAFFFSLIFLIVLVGMIYAIVQLVRFLPVYFRQAQDFMILFGVQVGRVGDKIVSPIIRIQTFTASVRTLARRGRR